MIDSTFKGFDRYDRKKTWSFLHRWKQPFGYLDGADL